MKKSLILAAAIALASPVFASDSEMTTELTVGQVLGTDTETITTALTDLGFEVRKIDAEDGKIEAYVVKGTTMAEVYVDAKTGEIVKVGGND